MVVIFYKSKLCPRCYLAKKYLHEITGNNPDIHVKEIDILKEPGRAWKDGIRMIPALKIDNQILSGLFLNKNAVSMFLARHNVWSNGKFSYLFSFPPNNYYLLTRNYFENFYCQFCWPSWYICLAFCPVFLLWQRAALWWKFATGIYWCRRHHFRDAAYFNGNRNYYRMFKK